MVVMVVYVIYVKCILLCCGIMVRLRANVS